MESKDKVDGGWNLQQCWWKVKVRTGLMESCGKLGSGWWKVKVGTGLMESDGKLG